MENLGKGKLNSEMIWKIWKISVLVIITPEETSTSCSSSSSASSSFPPTASSSSSTNWYFKRCNSNVAVWKRTWKKYGKMKCFKWPYLYLKKENQNWELPMCKTKYRNEYSFVCYKYAIYTLIQSVVSRHPKRQHE